MCTVTLIPKDNYFILTSNRDEKVGRKTLPIDFHEINGKQMLFPKDEVSGGTWIATQEQKMICLLNGGFKNHEKQYYYRHSRGVVITEILSFGDDLKNSLETYNYNELEPFTLIAVDWQKDLAFYQLVWDGNKKHLKELKTNKSHIWSSSTLYDDEMKDKRVSWFNDYKLNNKISKKSILKFHKEGGIGNEFYDLIIKRGDLQTRSITQVHFENHLPIMRYEDLLINEVFEKQFEIINI